MICWPTAQLKAAEALYLDLHEDRPYHDGSFGRWSKTRSRDFPFHAQDGVSIVLMPFEAAPDDDFLGDGSVAEQAVGDVGESDQHD